MKRWVTVKGNEIVSGPVGGEEPPSEDYIPYEEIIDLPDGHGPISVTVTVEDNVCTKRVFAMVDYAEQRKAAYPPMEDYLDAVVKGDQAQIDVYIAACQAVKTKYPKP